MKKRNFRYMATAALLAFSLTACNENKITDDPDNGLPPVLESVGATLGTTGRLTAGTRSVNTDDPSLTPCHERCGSGHTLTVTIGTDPANNACYVHDPQTDRWIPQGDGARFPDFGNHPISMRLCSGAADPVSEQTDGSSEKLLHADVLVHEIASHVPIKNLPSATLSHAHTLLEITFDASMNASDIDAVKVNGTLVPYNVKDGMQKGATYLLIVNPGTSAADITLTYSGIDYECRVEADAPFASNTRYAVPMELRGGELVCGSMLVKPWNESGGSQVQAGTTAFTLLGYENQILDVKIEGLDLFVGLLELDGNGQGTLPFVALSDYSAKIEYVQKPNHQQISVNLPLGSEVSHTVDSNTGAILSTP